MEVARASGLALLPFLGHPFVSTEMTFKRGALRIKNVNYQVRIDSHVMRGSEVRRSLSNSPIPMRLFRFEQSA